jgi:8-oxo-dGTP diphosphatase
MKFNIRVYGIFINSKNEVLVTDEIRFGIKMTKFPGGGLIPGEGTIDCLKRECKEELEADIEILKHFYTTDFFQKAMFLEDEQLIRIYYLAELKTNISKKITSKAYNFAVETEGAQTFRWLPVDEKLTGLLSFPIDKKIATMLINNSVNL